MEEFHRMEAVGVSVTIDLRVGHVRAFEAKYGGQTVRPLHSAPWVEDKAIIGDQSIPPNLRFLSGDFFCAPFGASDLEEAPDHGWTANSAWHHVGTEREGDAVTARFTLTRSILGAQVEKRFTLRDGHPFLYEEHIFTGGTGRIPVANHAMTRFGPSGGRLSFSPKAWGETPAMPLEPDPAQGRSALRYPARFTDLSSVPLASGGKVDIRDYPPAERHEDFVMLVEAPESLLGWTAALRRDESEIFLSLKNPAELPVTMLWFSNGGRDYAPWNGRHIGVLGIEEGRTLDLAGHRASIAPNRLSDAGIPTALDLDPAASVAVRNIIGGVAAPDGWEAVERIETAGDHLTIVTDGAGVLDVPCDTNFLRG